MKALSIECVLVRIQLCSISPECGIIIHCMNTSSDINIEKPKIIPALIAGFNTIASKPILILLPVLLDLFLWFGPAWQINDYFQPLFQRLIQQPALNAPEFAETLDNFKALYQDLLNNFNLAATLRTFPVGVPSLMVSKTPFLNPLGRPPIFSLETTLQVIGLWVLFLLIGFLLGKVYFQKISQMVNPSAMGKSSLSGVARYTQILLMPIVLLVILAIIIIPITLLITLISLISPFLSQIFITGSLVLILWVIMPLIFTPHSIFLYGQNLFTAMLTSINVVRFSMAKTAWFVLFSYVLIEGLNYLWRTPATDNWVLLIGILGHAFIVSAVIAASFHYFIDATRFTQTMLQVRTNSAK